MVRLRHPKLVSGSLIAGFMCDDHDDQSVPVFSDFKALAAKHIEEALGKSCKEREIHFRAFRLFFNTFHNKLCPTNNDETVDSNQQEEEEQTEPEEQDEQDSDLFETAYDRRKRIRLELGHQDTDDEEEEEEDEK